MPEDWNLQQHPCENRWRHYRDLVHRVMISTGFLCEELQSYRNPSRIPDVTFVKNREWETKAWPCGNARVSEKAVKVSAHQRQTKLQPLWTSKYYQVTKYLKRNQKEGTIRRTSAAFRSYKTGLGRHYSPVRLFMWKQSTVFLVHKQDNVRTT